MNGNLQIFAIRCEVAWSLMTSHFWQKEVSIVCLIREREREGESEREKGYIYIYIYNDDGDGDGK